jgi:hypothetical protein
MSSALDESRLGRLITGVILFALAVWLGFQGIKSGGLFAKLYIPMILLGVWLLHSPHWAFLLTYMTRAAGLMVPGTTIPIFNVMAWVVSLLRVARVTVSKEQVRSKSTASVMLMWAFLLVVGIVILARGIGLRIFGSTTWGGGAYIQILGACFFFLATRSAAIDTKQVRVLMMASAVLSVIPALTEQIIYRAPQLYWLGNFISMGQIEVVGAAGMAAGGIQEQQVLRFFSVSSISGVVLPLAYAWLPLKRRTPLTVFLFLLLNVICFGAIAMSGFRGAMFLSLAVVGIYMMCVARTDRLFIAILILAGVAALVGVFLFSRSLPLAAQRAISWVPFIDIDPFAKTDAAQSIDWRLEVWRMAWAEKDQYLWIGRGLTIDVLPVAYMRWDYYMTKEFYFYMHSYHSGPLALLIDFGIPGLVVGTSFMVATAAELTRRIRRMAHGTLSYRFALWLVVWYVINTASFFLIYGDMKAIFPSLLMNAALANVVINGASSRDDRSVGAGTASLPPRPAGTA